MGDASAVDLIDACHMNNKQRKAAYCLLAEVKTDDELKEEAVDYGDWYRFLTQHLIDTDDDD